jgi:NADH-quinone oxidoreductase subunit N
MSEFIYLIPPITVLVGALTLMFMSMYEKYSVKSFITVSTLFLIVALGFSLLRFTESYSVQPYNDLLNNV